MHGVGRSIYALRRFLQKGSTSTHSAARDVWQSSVKVEATLKRRGTFIFAERNAHRARAALAGRHGRGSMDAKLRSTPAHSSRAPIAAWACQLRYQTDEGSRGNVRRCVRNEEEHKVTDLCEWRSTSTFSANRRQLKLYRERESRFAL
jgi:hypothetical protein